jgi:SPP1 family predicted phage head-tail adaptor
MVDFSHTLVIERPYGEDLDSDLAPDVDDYGQPIRTFTDLATVPGLIQPRTTREAIASHQAGAEVGEHVIFMARRDVTTADRIRATDGTLYEITGIRDFAFGGLAHLELDARRIESPTLAIGS